MRYLERLRMEEARRRLEEGDPVAQAARLAGYDDPLYFSRRFRALHGVAPSAYRAVARGARP
jgi:AraC-like DNA-binding protein